MDEVVALFYSIAPLGSSDIVSTLLHIDDLIGQGIADIDAADRFEERLDAAINDARTKIASEIAEIGRPFAAPDEAASYALNQTVYRLSVETARKRARGSSAGLWYVFYGLRDTDKDGKIDTLRVLRVLHSAARPLTKEAPRPDTGE